MPAALPILGNLARFHCCLTLIKPPAAIARMMPARYGGGQREAGSRVMISRLPGLTAGAVAAAVFLILFPGALSAQGARDAGSPAAEPGARGRALKFSSE